MLVGNGSSLQVEGLIGRLHVQVQGNLLQFPAYLLPMAGATIILGVTWLATLGPHIVDYSTLLQFYYDNKFISLHGEKILHLN